jgi:hypothetical protein
MAVQVVARKMRDSIAPVIFLILAFAAHAQGKTVFINIKRRNRQAKAA